MQCSFKIEELKLTLWKIFIVGFVFNCDKLITWICYSTAQTAVIYPKLQSKANLLGKICQKDFEKLDCSEAQKHIFKRKLDFIYLLDLSLVFLNLLSGLQILLVMPGRNPGALAMERHSFLFLRPKQES